MHKTFYYLLVIIGWLIVIYSLLVLIQCFDKLSGLKPDITGTGYILGSIIAPMILLATGRWMIRKAMKRIRNKDT